MGLATPVAEQLADLIGPGAVVDVGQLPGYTIGAFLPTAVARPENIEGVRAVVSWAHRSGMALYPVGGRTMTQLGNPPTRPGIALDLSRLNRVVDFQPADLTVSVEAGITIKQLDAALAQDGKHVPIAVSSGRRATVGGTLATGTSGPLRSAYGLPRDWLIGLNVVGPDGNATKAGGKVVKNVTGYDLNRLYTGSLGTLGIITEATFKLAPAPSEWAVIIASFPDPSSAGAAGQKLQEQVYAPLGLVVLTGAAATRISLWPFSAADGAIAVAMIGGRLASTNRRIGDTVAMWRGLAGSIDTLHGDEATGMIDDITDLPSEGESPPNISVRINAPPSTLKDVLCLGQTALANAGPPAVIADVGFGGGRLLWWENAAESDAGDIAAGLRDIQTVATALGGGAIVERCPEQVKNHIDVWGEPSSGMAIMRRLKRQFDPDNILNPGRFVGGL